MKHPIVIDSFGHIRNRDKHQSQIWKNLQSSFNKIFNAPLRPSTYYMCQQDYKDILKWSTEK